MSFIVAENHRRAGVFRINPDHDEGDTIVAGDVAPLHGWWQGNTHVPPATEHERIPTTED